MEKFDTISHPPFLRSERFELHATGEARKVYAFGGLWNKKMISVSDFYANFARVLREAVPVYSENSSRSQNLWYRLHFIFGHSYKRDSYLFDFQETV